MRWANPSPMGKRMPQARVEVVPYEEEAPTGKTMLLIEYKKQNDIPSKASDRLKKYDLA